MKRRCFALRSGASNIRRWVTPNPPDGVFIDVAGSAHLFHGEAALLQHLRNGG
jgi:hypothetical protein